MRIMVMSITVVILVATAGQAQQMHKADWWLSLSQASRVDYANGLVDGLVAAIWVLGVDPETNSPLGSGSQAETDRLTTYTRSVTRFTYGVAAEELARGLDRFYSDTINRGIQIPTAAWMVFCQIKRVPDDNIQELIQRARGLSR